MPGLRPATCSLTKGPGEGTALLQSATPLHARRPNRLAIAKTVVRAAQLGTGLFGGVGGAVVQDQPNRALLRIIGNNRAISSANCFSLG